MFKMYSQNNSGGSFVYDEVRGISLLVIVEGSDSDDIKERAEDIGLYFNGVSEGIDCSCCGDRWCQYDGELDDKSVAPNVYGENVFSGYYRGHPYVNYGVFRNVYRAREFSFPLYIHYADGTVGAISADGKALLRGTQDPLPEKYWLTKYTGFNPVPVRKKRKRNAITFD